MTPNWTNRACRSLELGSCGGHGPMDSKCTTYADEFHQRNQTRTILAGIVLTKISTVAKVTTKIGIFFPLGSVFSVDIHLQVSDLSSPPPGRQHVDSIRNIFPSRTRRNCCSNSSCLQRALRESTPRKLPPCSSTFGGSGTVCKRRRRKA